MVFRGELFIVLSLLLGSMANAMLITSIVLLYLSIEFSLTLLMGSLLLFLASHLVILLGLTIVKNGFVEEELVNIALFITLLGITILVSAIIIINYVFPPTIT